MASTYASLRGAIGAARVILEQCRGQPVHAAVSQVQKNAVIDSITRADTVLEAQEKAALSHLLLAVPWAGEDAAHALESLVKGGVDKSRRRQQDFKAIVCYLDQPRWDHILDSNATALDKEELLFGLLKSLGCATPRST
jgi:hypothetical protein